MKFFKFTVLFLIMTCLMQTYNTAFAKSSELVDSSTIVKYMPDRVKLNADGSGVATEVVQTTFRKNTKFPLYTIIKYLNMEDICEIVVLKNEGKRFIQMGKTVVRFPDELSGCSIDSDSLKDLNGDGKLELVVQTGDYKSEGPPAFLKWDGRKLVDISPVKAVNGEMTLDLRDVAISTERIQNKLMIYDYDSSDSTTGKRIFEMINGDIRLIGSYDLVSLIPAGDVQTIKPSFPAEAQYTLTVKNLSDHNRAVRAEVTLNGSVVLKPQDFCKTPPPKKTNKKWWFGHDDDDDGDYDHCKRCVPKNEAYAIVNMKTANEIKVKVYGRRDSKVQLTLVKKP